MSSTITLQQVLFQMDSGNPFSISFVTADNKKNEGGEWIDIAQAYKHEFVTRRQMNEAQKYQPKSNVLSKNPNHYANSTRNIRLPNGEIRKLHIRLITKFNNQIVT